MNEFSNKVEVFKREELRKLYEQCTEKQQAFFNRLWKSVDEISEENIPIAYDQCKQTIKKNMENMT